MAKYRKKPVVIEAFKWTGGIDQTEDPEWIVDALLKGKARIIDRGDKVIKSDGVVAEELNNRLTMDIETLEGVMTAEQGDYIIKGVQGELYPCKPDIFEQTYERV